MPDLNVESIEGYLSRVFGKKTRVVSLSPLGREPGDKALKGYGYGTPVRLEYELGNHEHHAAVLHTLSPGPFGHELMSDRAKILLWEYQAFNGLPRHVRAISIGGFQSDHSLISLADLQEVFLLTEYVEGSLYAEDLARLRDGDEFTGTDRTRADSLCDYLLDIHRIPGNDAAMYARRIRELVGHNECIMGVTDSYPPGGSVSRRMLEDIEHGCVEWRWRLKGFSHRLRQVHGDFHPWNILFRSETDFSVLDRSRGEFGDPADDVACLTLNYVFFSLQRTGSLDGCFENLFRRFWERYLEKSGDTEMLRVVAPYYAFRALVMASPFWYPNLADSVRSKLLVFTFAVLGSDSFDPGEVNAYCGS